MMPCLHVALTASCNFRRFYGPQLQNSIVSRAIELCLGDLGQYFMQKWASEPNTGCPETKQTHLWRSLRALRMDAFNHWLSFLTILKWCASGTRQQKGADKNLWRRGLKLSFWKGPLSLCLITGLRSASDNTRLAENKPCSKTLQSAVCKYFSLAAPGLSNNLPITIHTSNLLP